jgi:hypothetical protein
MGERRDMSAGSAEREAAKLLRQLPVETMPVPVEEIAEHLRAAIVRERLESTISGLLLPEGGAKLIAVNSAHHPRRQRFTIAHELGHLQMHDGAYIVDSTVRVNRRDGPIQHGKGLRRDRGQRLCRRSADATCIGQRSVGTGPCPPTGKPLPHW